MQLILTILLLASLVAALPHTAPAPVKRATGCLGSTFVRGPRPGITVDLLDCDGAAVLFWDIERGAGKVKVSGLGLVLDAGFTPANFGFLTTETPVDGKPAQNWYYTDDNRIAITGGNQCLDDDGTRLQTYQCTTGNTNQIFYADTPPNNEPQPVNPYPDIPQGAVYPDQGADRRRIHPLNRGDLCVTVLGGSFVIGNSVGIAYCLPDTNPLSTYQIFNIQATASRVPGPLRIADAPMLQGLCLSSSLQNGAGVTVQFCGPESTRWQ
ncbi:uncharacterized protein MKK02DRAFT_39251 [Dioszegia hungarica]|uniref:Ricin B lectin domain-containing protein n=1 Tax=Dioszegia hungarica TaxID=4972 RepID=A0AA38H229_9TREE|nr:uncharacterized protein MKK02DRAFT_39251 [Dioszegia hungarica]KAI9633272.1 hypothetical protein MKK02DRAFT_39251 [Dioszegia hungarica]